MNDDMQTMPVFDLVDQMREKIKETDMDPLTALVLSVLLNRLDTLGRSMAEIEVLTVMANHPSVDVLEEVHKTAKRALS